MMLTLLSACHWILVACSSLRLFFNYPLGSSVYIVQPQPSTSAKQQLTLPDSELCYYIADGLIKVCNINPDSSLIHCIVHKYTSCFYLTFCFVLSLFQVCVKLFLVVPYIEKVQLHFFS